MATKPLTVLRHSGYGSFSFLRGLSRFGRLKQSAKVGVVAEERNPRFECVNGGIVLSALDRSAGCGSQVPCLLGSLPGGRLFRRVPAKRDRLCIIREFTPGAVNPDHCAFRRNRGGWGRLR